VLAASSEDFAQPVQQRPYISPPIVRPYDLKVAWGEHLGKEARLMMEKLTLSLANEAIERILELSADTQITRRMTAKDSPAFHNLTGAIAAHGKTLALLTALQQREEFYEVIGECEFSECAVAFS
jgi:hypothetical protein